MDSLPSTPHTVFIALSGKKQVGKDTATQIIKETLEARGYRVGVTAFAEALKEMCINVLGLKRELVYGSNDDKDAPSGILWDGFPLEIRIKRGTFERTDDHVGLKSRTGPMTVREVLQIVGTDIFRAIEDDVWARAPFNRDWSGYDVVLLTDCRFPNEKRVTEEHGGVIIRLERQTGFVDNHASETALDDAEFDSAYYYRNDGTLDELRSFVESVLEKLNLNGK